MDAKREAFRTKWALANDKVVVSIVGRLTGIKNHKLFLEAMQKVMGTSSKPIIGLVVGGGELEDELKSWCAERDIMYSSDKDSGIIFTGWEKDVDSVMAGSDIVAMTSYNEGTPVSLIEAQSAGVPVISTNVGGVNDIVEHGVSGLLVPSDDVDAFAEGLRQMIESQEMRDRFGHAGKHVAPKYSHQRLVADMRRLYENLL